MVQERVNTCRTYLYVFAVVAMTAFTVACSPTLDENEMKKAKSLAMSNIICESLVNYRVGQVLLLARDGKHHKELGETIGNETDLDVQDTRQKMDMAFGEDLNKLFNSKSKDEYEVVVMDLFSYTQENIIKMEFGYSYPDCDMVISMSEAFIDQNNL